MAASPIQHAEPVDPRELGELFAQAVAGDPAAVRLWVSSDGRTTKLWLQIEPVGREDQMRFYRLANELYDRIPGSYFDLHLLSPCDFEEFVPEELVPPDSAEIPLPAA